ncbi:MAG: septum formation initiator family protein [Spirochaetaceae bacterium]|nr:MAG: septum formation initiator family protein [Spirochaetaceae bacterium]
MTLKSLGIAACVTVWSYLLLTFAFGERGIVAYGRVEQYRDELRAHIELLETDRDRLAATAERLQTDPEQIRIESRRIGYLRPDEGIIRIPGRPSSEPQIERPGDKLPRPERHAVVDRSLLRALALCLGLLSFVLVQTIFRASR